MLREALAVASRKASYLACTEADACVVALFVYDAIAATSGAAVEQRPDGFHDFRTVNHAVAVRIGSRAQPRRRFSE